MRHSLTTEFASQVVEHASAVLCRVPEPGELVGGPIHGGHLCACPAHGLLEAPCHRVECVDTVSRWVGGIVHGVQTSSLPTEFHGSPLDIALAA
jgi:hypothetical protein